MRVKRYKPILLVGDIFVITVAIIISYWMKQRHLIDIGARFLLPELRPSILIPFGILIISFIIILKNSNLYRMHVLFDSYYQFVVIVKSVLVSYGILIATLFLLKHPLLEQRGIITPSFVLVAVLLMFYRILLLKYTLRFALKNKIIGERVILIGASIKGREIAKELINNKYAYFTPIAFLDDKNMVGKEVESLKVIDTISNIDKYTEDFDEILITLTNVTYNELQEIMNKYRRLDKPIHVISDLYRIIPEKLEVEKFNGFSTFQVPPAIGFKQYPFIIFKRVVDYTVALALIFFLLPVWIIIAVLIKIGSEGPVFYKAEVVGYKEKSFTWYKFRTMHANSDDSIHKKLVKEIARGVRNGEKLQDDPRITRIGKWLRKFSIDEFPQLINVLKGQMSLVGPRPVLPYEYELLDDWQKERFTILPGMTGLWQIRGRNKVNFEDQHVLDLYYVKNRSIMMDTTILFNTVSVVISGKTGI